MDFEFPKNDGRGNLFVTGVLYYGLMYQFPTWMSQEVSKWLGSGL